MISKGTLGNRKEFILASIIVLCGLILRVNKIGQNSFWFDEANVALASAETTFGGMIEVAKSHAMAMPLNYLVTWLMSRIGQDEGWLRIPAAIWGTGSIIVVYLLSRMLFRLRYVILVSSLLAISPVLIWKSQDMRFWSVAVFFYILVTYLMLNAIQYPSRTKWFWVGITAIIGSYFNLFVLFAFVNGFMWILITNESSHINKSSLRSFLICGFCVGIAILPGVLIFGSDLNYKYEPTLAKAFIAITGGLGWLPVYSDSVNYGWFYGVFLFILSSIGVYFAIKERNRQMISLLISMVIQIILIVAAIFWKSYFFTPRQFLILVPLNFIIIGWVISRIFDNYEPKSLRFFRSNPGEISGFLQLVILFLILGLITANFPSLNDYYQHKKSYGWEISQILSEEWTDGDTIWVFPSWEPTLFRYYLERKMNDYRLNNSFTGIDFSNMNILDKSGKVFLITNSGFLTYDLKNQINNSGFSEYPVSNSEFPPHQLWVLE